MTSSAPLRERIVPFEAGDGRPCSLVNYRRDREPHRGPVLLVHGAGTRATIFQPPATRTLVDHLVDDGYDVWNLNWRASIDFPPNMWTLDQAAVYDHPMAVRRIVAETGHDRMKAIVHCQGSTSFFMAAAAGLVPEVTTIVSNAVSMHLAVPALSWWKVQVGARMTRYLTDYMNPQWGNSAPTIVAKLIDGIVRLTHHECRNAVCKHVSFTYGAGWPSLWSHDLISPETHDWIRGQFAFCPMTFFLQMARSISAGRIVAVDGLRQLPPDVLARRPETDARMVFLAGAASRCFLPASQTRTFEYFDRLRPNYHKLYLLPKYGHLDVFIGKDATRDVFPIIVSELNRQPA